MLKELPRPQQPEFDIAVLTPLEILRAGIETERLESIPLEAVQTEQAIVDDSHALELSNSMSQKRGQLSPIVVRAREAEENKVEYDIMDGFHRTAGKKRSGDTHIDAKVVYGCDDEEMYDLRILAASSVRSVQFPRVAQWITDSFSTTAWAEKGLTVTQAFAIAQNDSQRTRGIQLSPSEIQELKLWVKEKCTKWGKPVTSTYGILRLVANADPNLVAEVRNSGGGKDRTGRITPDRLKAVVETFPGENNWANQRAILKAAVENRLTLAETELLVKKVSSDIKPGMSESDLYSLTSRISKNIDEIKEFSTQTNNRVIFRRSSIHTNAKRRNADLQRHYPEEENKNQSRINFLSGELALTQYNLEQATWWRSSETLRPFEKAVMELVIFDRLSVKDAANKLHTNPKQVANAIAQAIHKDRKSLNGSDSKEAN